VRAFRDSVTAGTMPQFCSEFLKNYRHETAGDEAPQRG
jgi:hypothetical protein